MSCSIGGTFVDDDVDDGVDCGKLGIVGDERTALLALVDTIESTLFVDDPF